ncbi:NifU family protein [Streptomyces sp. ACA25]|uniref:NifU family protein n=1 Tax=Streptomyces sp. ACA25 TaxID=3022596 RepID=UPI0023075A5C|nr:NifU family protein [Streptomyces sp. ACA25]MDB1088535.1 NifU family protein [Streptomyces sp. ACA25]
MRAPGATAEAPATGPSEGPAGPVDAADAGSAVRAEVVRAEQLLAGLDSLPDTAARSRALAAVQALMGLYGDCLARILEQAGDELTRTLAADELVGHLLLAHGLHPEPVANRVRTALREVRPLLKTHGGDVELLGIDGPVVRVRLHGSCGCPSSAAGPEQAVRDAVTRYAPEIEHLEAESTAGDGGISAPAPPLIPVDALFQGRPRPAPVAPPPAPAGVPVAAASAARNGTV